MTNVDPSLVDAPPGTPSPLAMPASSASPLQMGVAQDANTSHRIQLITSAAPVFNNSPSGIQAALQMAQSSMSDADIVSTAKSQAAMMMTDSIKTQLDQEQDPSKKWQLWNSLDDTQHKMLLQSGFTAPTKVDPTPDTSPWGITKGIVGGLFQDVKDVTQLPGAKQVLSAVGKPLSAMQHLYRAGALGIQEEGLFGIGGTITDAEKEQRRGSLGGILNDAVDLWDRTGNGAKTFSAKSMDRLNSSMGADPDKVSFVKAMAAGESVDDFLTKDMKMSSTDPNYSDQVTKFNEYLGDQKVQDSITDLKNNQLSFGRQVASRVAKRGSLTYNIVSGGLDATFDVVGDPTLWATEGLAGYRQAARGVMTLDQFTNATKLAEGLTDAEKAAKYSEYVGNRVQYLADNVPKFNAGMDNIVDKLSTGQPDVLMDQMPSVRKGINSMTTYFAQNHIPLETLTRDDVVNFFKDSAQSGQLFNGNFSVPHFDGISLPSFGRMQAMKAAFIDTGKQAIEGFRLADLGLDGMSREQLQQLFQNMDKSKNWATLAQTQNGVGEFLKSLVTKVPTQDYMKPFDSAAPQNFRNMMSYVLPPSMQQGFLNDFLRAGTYEARRDVYTSALDAMWQYSGAAMTDEGKQIYQKVTMGDQVYMGHGMDLVNGTPAGVLENDAARAWAIPNFPDMLKATKDTTTARRLLDETNDGLVSKFMNVWRPAVLMRVGFIPRSYGEEMLTFIHREGLGAYVKSQAARAAINPDDAWFTKPVSWLSDSVFKHVPYVGNTIQAMADHMVNYANQYFKNFSEKVAGDDLVQYARTLAARPELQNAFAREAGSFHGMAAESLGERSRREVMFKQDANGDIVPANITFGQITSHFRGDAFYHHTVYREMMRVADSQLAQPVMDAMTRSMGLEEGSGLQQLFNESGFLPQMEPHIPMVPEGQLKLANQTQDEYVAAKARTPLTMNTIAPLENPEEHYLNPNVKVERGDYQHIYQYQDANGNVLAQSKVDMDTDSGLPHIYNPTALPGQQDKVDEILKAMHGEGTGAEQWSGFGQTKYGAEQEFKNRAAPEMVPGEPQPRDDLNYGAALLRARQQVPNQVMPAFEHYLRNPAYAGEKTVIGELVEHGMPEDQASVLVQDILPRMTPRQRVAVFTQDGVLERNLQAKMVDPNQEFDLANIPGYTSDRYYHGSYRLPDNGKLRPIYYHEGNLYGPGFYTTANPSIASEYAEFKTLHGVEPQQGLFQLGWQGRQPPNLIDLDKPPTPEIRDLIDQHYGPQEWEYGDELVRPSWIYDEDDVPPTDKPLGDVLQDLSERYDPTYGAPAHSQERAQNLIDELNARGYDGWTHIGGGRVGEIPHKVSIFFDTDRLGVLKAPQMKTTADFLPAVRQAAALEAQRQYEEILKELWSEGGSPLKVGQQLAADRLSQGDMGEYVNLMRRGREVEGDRVASVPDHGMRRLYTVVGPPNVAAGPGAPLRYAPLGNIFDAQEGWVPLAHGDLGTILDNQELLNSKSADQAWFTTDHHEATDLHQKLMRYKPGENAFQDAANMHVAYVDVPEDVFRMGQAAAQSAGGGGLDPLAKSIQGNSVWLPKTWRTNYQALGDDYQLLEPPVQNGYARLYRVHGMNTDSGKELWTSDGDLAKAMLPFEENAVKYADIPAGDIDKYRPGEGNFDPQEFHVTPGELNGKDLPTYPSTGVDQKAALQEWGYYVSQKVHQVFGGNGNMDETLQDVIHNALHDNLRLDHLWPLKTTQLPDETIGPQILANDPQSFLNRVTRHGFDAITQAGDAMIRSPMFLWNYAKNESSIRALVEANLGDPQANQIINEVADHLGYKRGQVLAAWHSLPDDIKEAVNPMEAAIRRDPIPPNLRLLESHEDLQKLGNAADALYNLKDGSMLNEIRDEIEQKRLGIRGAFPSIAPDAETPSLDDLTDSYLGLPEKVRTNIMQNGLPDVFPQELMGKEMPLSSDQWAGFKDAVDKNKYIEDTIHQITAQRATNDSIPWIHNHHLRSQFQEHARNFIPFWFAQENFIGRAANLMVRDPAIIRQAQLGVHGLQTFGAITKNQYGEDVYNIPFTGALMKVLSKGADLFGKYSIPINDPMTGQLKYTLPGIDELTNIAPSFSPIAALPMQALSSLIPELKPMSDFVSGDRGSRENLSLQSFFKQITPSYLYNIWEGISADPNSDLNLVSNQIQTAQRLEAAGHGMPEASANSMNVPSKDAQDYIDRLQNHSRLAMMVKGVLGFFSPVSPDINPEEHFSPEFQKLLRDMPLNDALTTFTAQHPNALPYTVMKTKVTSGAPLPSTPDALAMMDQHPDFFAKYPNAGAWFLPQSTVQDQFAQDAYNQQLAMNLRQNKTLVDWYKDYYFASAATDYFDTKDGYDKRFAAAKGNPALRQQMTDQYNTWKQQYFTQHPVFAEEIQSPDGQQRRARIIDEMQKALDDPVAQQSPQAKPMSDMLDTYLGAKNRLALYPRSDTMSTQVKQGIKDQFVAWAANYAMDHPQINAFYTRVIKPEISSW